MNLCTDISVNSVGFCVYLLSFRPTGVDPHFECGLVPSRRPAPNVRLQLRLKTGNKRIALDQACLRQIDHVADVAIIAALQFRECKIVRFESPEAHIRPHRKYSDQTIFVVRRIACHSDSVDVDVMFPLQDRAFTSELENLLRHVSWNHCEDIQIPRLPSESIVLADYEAANAMEVRRPRESTIQFGEE